MLANNVRQITTSEGLGPLTLGPSVDYGRTLSSQYGIGDPIPYTADDRAGNWEMGIGHLSDPNTLVRDIFVDGSASTFISFAAGTKQVFITPHSGSFAPSSQGQMDYNNVFGINCGPQPGAQGHSDRENNKQFARALQLDEDLLVSFLGFYVSTSSPTATARCGISRLINGVPEDLYLMDEVLDVTSTGNIETPLPTPLILKAGWYLIHYLCDESTVVLEGLRTQSWNPFPTLTAGGRNGPSTQLNYVSAPAWSALVSPTLLVSNSFERYPPQGWLVGVPAVRI